MPRPLLPPRILALVAALLALLPAAACAPEPVPVVPPRDLPGTAALAAACQGRDGWSDPAPPAHVFGNVWYVGTCGITSLLISSDEGHVLIDAPTEAAAPMIARNIEALGFRLSDVRWLVNSHEHSDHIGGLAAMKRMTGARVAATALARPMLESGTVAPDDPQSGISPAIAPVAVDRVLADGETLTLGPIAITAHSTPAHSPGSTSWTWTSCEGATCHQIAYVDSLTTISADGYRYSRHPGRDAAVRRGLAAAHALRCDLLLTPHPSASSEFERFAGKLPLYDPAACQAYAERGAAGYAARLAREAAGTEP